MSEDKRQAAPDQATSGEFPIYPLLFALAPILSVFGSNLSVFSVQDLIRPVIAVALGSGLILVVLAAVTRSWQKGAASSLPLLAAWWLFDPLLKALSLAPGVPALALFSLATALAVWVLVRWSPKPKFLNAASVILTALLGGNALARLGFPPQAAPSQEGTAQIRLSSGVKPSIFFIVPDGFGRLDVLKEKHRINLDWFAQALKERGFQIAEGNHSCYIQTQLSLASTLNLQSLDSLAQAGGKPSGDRRMFGPLITHSLTARILKESGYEHITVGSGYEGIKLGGREVPLEVRAPLTLFEASLLKKTPIALLPWLDEVQSVRHRGHLESAFKALQDLAQPGPKPRFVMAHLLTPHPPFVVDEEGSPIEPKGGFAISDGDDYRRLVAGPEDYRAGYAKKAQYTARRLLEVVDALLSGSKGSPPIIVIQGDHGSKLGVSHRSLEETDLKEGFSCFYALYSPPSVPVTLPKGDVSVNTFRRIFTAMGAEKLPPLEPKSWYSSFDRPLEFVDVTSRIPEAP